MIEQLNKIADVWWAWMWPMSWQVSVLIVFIGVADFFLRKRVWPQVRYALWLLIMVKLILPPTFSLSTSIVSQLRPWAEQAIMQQASRGELPTLANLHENLTVEKPVVDTQNLASASPIKSGTAPTTGAGANGGFSTAPAGALARPFWQFYVMLVWLLGVVILATWLIVKFRQLRSCHLEKADDTDLPDWLKDLRSDTAKKLNLKYLPELILSQNVSCPAVFGIFRPVLLLPRENITKISRKDVEHILLHELAHIKRGDLWVHGVYMVLQLIYWFNPLLWLVRRKLQHSRELCCDATVAAILREKTTDYRKTILQTAKWLLDKPKMSGIGILGLVERPSRLLVRLNWLEKKTWRYQKMKRVTIITVAVLMITFVLPMAKAGKPEKGDTSPAIKHEQKSAKSLHQAAAARDVDVVKELISKGADVNSKDEFGQTPLHLAARYGHRSVAEGLIASGANIQAEDQYGSTPLHYAAEHDQTDVAELLIDKGANVNVKNNRGWTALHYTAEYGRGTNTSMAELLIAKGADVNAEANDGATPVDISRWSGRALLIELLVAKGAKIDVYKQTNSWKPIHTSARYGQKERVQLLLDQGSDVNTKDAGGYTPLHHAAEKGHKDVCELLVLKGANVNAKDTHDWRPLHCAAKYGHTNVAELLITNGADVNARNKWGETPLRLAAELGQKAMTELLIAKGADVNAKVAYGWAPLHYATRRGHEGVVKMLVDKGADINAQEAGLNTPLHFATGSGREDIARLLIDKGADINARNSRGLTPLHYAAMRRLNELVKLLIAKNAEVNAKDNSGMTALHYASANNQKDIVELLIANGAELNAEDVVGATPLHKAAERGQKDTAEMLLAKGANINAKDYWGSTPLHVTAEAGQKAVAELLIAKGADVNIKNRRGETPLSLAKQKGHNEIVELLRKHGARE